jgi:hypothetical protein
MEFINEKAMKIIFTLDHKKLRSEPENVMRNICQPLPVSLCERGRSI